MAGDWLKIEVCTPDKPEVFLMAEKLGIDSDAVMGKLFRVWGWFDQHTEKGNDASVTTALINRCAGVAGFAEAMLSVGWLLNGQRGLELPNFDRHNGETAKSRALTAKRVAAHKKRNGNGVLTPGALPREEKRRTTTPHSPSSRKKPATPPPSEFEITEQMWGWVKEQGIDPNRVVPETMKFMDHHKAKGSTFSDWSAAWRKWMRNVVEFSANGRPH